MIRAMGRRIAALGLVLAFVACGGGSRPPGPPDVVLIVVDTLRASHLGSYGYDRPTSPFLDSFAKRSLRFERAIAAAPWTSPSVASILSSLYPPAHGIARGEPDGSEATALVLDDEIVTLAELLRENGYQTLGVVANRWISSELGYGQGFDEFVLAPKPPASVHRGYAPAGEVNELVYGLLRDRNKERPVFLYVQFMDPHKPYDPPAEYLDLFRGTPPGHAFAENRYRLLIDAYDGEIRYLDGEIERLFAFLDREGLYEDSVVVVTADHGEQIYEYGQHNHGYSVHNVEVHVPLMVRVPGTPLGTSDALVSTVDILPTILDALSIEVRHPIQGVSLLRDIDVRRERGVYSGTTYWGNMKSFTRSDGRKLVVSYDGDDERSASVAIYDSLGDYLERSPLDAEDELLRDLQSRFDAVHEESVALGAGRSPRSVELDDEARDQLKTLGYLE